jgi:uncharacterized hydrophobic protein (TIGR00271 family)
MSEDQDPENEKRENINKATQETRFTLLRLWVSLRDLLKEILSIHEGTEYEETTRGIKRDIDFHGHNVWILIFSIFIASIGLNVNSGAVIVGAMLISPLMGPILGLGLSLGTYDIATLKRSLKSFGVMVFVAIFTSAIYFFFTPLREAQSELLSRTNPTLLDVFVALFGGLAGIMAGSRKEKSNVIPGVAIATALMPPLCTAGYGLATMQLSYFFGALYLFLINSIFICLATLAVVRYLRFPMVRALGEAQERRGRRWILFIVGVVVIPSIFMLVDVVEESFFYQRSNNFIKENIVYDENVVSNVILEYNDTLSTIIVFLEGGKTVPAELQEEWRRRMPSYKLTNARLKIVQSGADFDEYMSYMEEYKAETFKELYLQNQEVMRDREKQIRDLELELESLRRDSIPFDHLKRELRIQYPEMMEFTYAYAIRTDYSAQDTVVICLVKWKDGMRRQDKEFREQQMSDLLEVRLNLDSVLVLETKP